MASADDKGGRASVFVVEQKIGVAMPCEIGQAYRREAGIHEIVHVVEPC